MTSTWKLMVAAAGALVLAVLFVVWTREHDARILAEDRIKQSDTRIAQLEQDKAAIIAAGQKQIVVLQQQKEQVKTPAQAIAAMPDVSSLPLNARPLPDMPDAVAVDAVPLYQELNECKQMVVGFGVCKDTLAKEQQETTELKGQVADLQKAQGGGFWRRLSRCVVRGGVGAGAGGMFGGSKGLIGGAALGFGSCLVVKP